MIQWEGRIVGSLEKASLQNAAFFHMDGPMLCIMHFVVETSKTQDNIKCI